MHQLLQEYNRILGVREIQSREQLKRAYRHRAKYLHPDSHSRSASHDQFVLLQQAYEFYSKAFDGTLQPKTKEPKSRKYPPNHTDPVQEEFRKDARKRAAEKERMKKACFEAKGYFRILDNMFYLITVLRVAQAVALLIGLPVFIFHQDGFRGLISVLIVQCLTYPLWSPYVRVIFQRKWKKVRNDYF